MTANPNQAKPRRFFAWSDLGLVIGLALLAYVLSRYPLGEVYDACRRIGPLVLVTPVIALGWHACNTSAFSVLLDDQVPWRSLLWNRLVGDGYNHLLPLAGIGGEPFKLRHLTHWLPSDRIVAALIRDRVIESSFGLLFTGTCLALTQHHYALPTALRTALWAFIGVCFVLGLSAFAVVSSRLPGRAGAVVGRWLGATELSRLERLPLSSLLRCLAWHFPARVLGLVEVGVMFWLLDLPVDLAAVAFCDNFLNAGGFVGFAIPQGIGVLEGTSAFAFQTVGYPGALSIAFALARRGRALIVSLFGIALHTLALRRGHRGRPRDDEAWEAEYRTGHWTYLDSPRELAHYAMIVGYVQQFGDKPKVLDVGCGHGRLRRLLGTMPLSRYLGIDVSSEAVKQARESFCCDVTQFEVGTFEAGPQLAEQFDFIIFNESIYYASDPIAVLRTYRGQLAAGGTLIVSIRDMRKNRRIRAAIQAHFPASHSTMVTNEYGERWHVDCHRVAPRT